MTTPEVAAYRESAASVEQWNKRLWKAIALVAMSCLLLVSAALTFVVIEVGAIRGTQLGNSRAATCQARAIDGLLKDVPLAFAGDKNPADYSKVPHQCPSP